jgi:hypothetical protein
VKLKKKENIKMTKLSYLEYGQKIMEILLEKEEFPDKEILINKTRDFISREESKKNNKTSSSKISPETERLRKILIEILSKAPLGEYLTGGEISDKFEEVGESPIAALRIAGLANFAESPIEKGDTKRRVIDPSTGKPRNKIYAGYRILNQD